MTTSVALHAVAGGLMLNQLSDLPPSEPIPKIIEITLFAPEAPVEPVAVIEPEPQPQLLEAPPEPITPIEPGTRTTVEPKPPVAEPATEAEPEATSEPAPLPRKAKTKKPEKSVIRKIAKAEPAMEPPIPAAEAVQKNKTREEPVADEVPDQSASNSNAKPSVPSEEVKSELAAVAPARPAEAPLTLPHSDAAYLNNPKPPYPAAARRFNLEGTVILRVMVKASGTPETVRIEQTSGAAVLDDAALAAVKGWRFVPARQGDTPIDHWVDVPVRFRLTSANAE